MLFTKPLDAITESDLQLLRDDRVEEHQSIDYKEILSFEKKSDTQKDPKDELRADVSSFANATGGYIVIGMSEKDGFPIELCGMDIPNREAFSTRIQEVLQTNISPRIPGVAIHFVPLQNGKSAAVIRIPQSFAKPHQVKVNKDDYQFWSRKSSGKMRLTVDELRSIFLQSETLNERIRSFRQERLGNLVAGETPYPLVAGARTVLHMIPLNAFDPATRHDVAALENDRDRYSLMACPSQSEGNWASVCRHNLEGYLSIVGGRDAACSYLQIFRNGIIEGVEAESINWPEQTPSYWSSYDETLLINAVKRGVALYLKLGVDPPIVILVTLLGVKGWTIYGGQPYRMTESVPFRTDAVLLPDVLVEDFAQPSWESVRPVLDAIWNTGGYARCLNYNAEGLHRPTD